MDKIDVKSVHKNLAERTAKELSDSVYRTIMGCFEREMNWRELATRRNEEIASEIVNGHDAENKRLKDMLRFCVAELYSEKELEAYNAFCEKHMKCRLDTKIHGGMMPYVVQYGTGIGVITKVHCQVCGEEEDITDSDVWG